MINKLVLNKCDLVMKNTTFLLYILLIYLNSAYGQLHVRESVYPEGSDISVAYQVNDTLHAGGDTITISRTIANNSSLPMINLYLADVLPDMFEPVGYKISIIDRDISHYYNANDFAGYFGYTRHEWVLDYPGQDDTANTHLMAGETLYLKANFICNTPGDYLLPFHTICMHNGETGIFSVASPITIRVSEVVGIDDEIQPLPEKSGIPLAYPNPFNGDVRIMFNNSSDGNGYSGILSIFDITGRLVFKSKPVINDAFYWRPSPDLAGGVYFYNIITDENKYQGKLVYLK